MPTLSHKTIKQYAHEEDSVYTITRTQSLKTETEINNREALMFMYGCLDVME